MFTAIGRYFRAFVYLITGRVDTARKELSKNPYVIQATFDRIVEEKTRRIQQYKDAVAAMIAQQEKKLATIKTLSDEVAHLERLKEGAAAKAKTVVDRLKGQGQSQEQIKQDQEYLKCLSAFNEFTTSLQEKNNRIAELEDDVKELGDNIGGHKVQLQALLREIEKLKEEAAATVADMITAKEEEEIANMLAGISDETHAKELQDMRELRQQQKAQARVAREMAGTDTKRQEAEFLEYARTGAATDEFDKLIGLASETDAASQADGAARDAESKSKLPEA